MDLNNALRSELARVIPVIQNTFTFSVSFKAAAALLEGRGESGAYMIATSMTTLLLLLGIQIKCKQCEQTYKAAWFGPILTMGNALIESTISMSTAFVSNLFASVLINVMGQVITDGWIVWWGAFGLSLTTIAVQFVL